MHRFQHVIAAFALLFATVPAHADRVREQVVIVDLCVTEQASERVEAALTTPVERLLRDMPGVKAVNSITSEGNTRLTVHFAGGASGDDAASVALALERDEGALELAIMSRSGSVKLGQANSEGFAPGLPACGVAQR